MAPRDGSSFGTLTSGNAGGRQDPVGTVDSERAATTAGCRCMGFECAIGGMCARARVCVCAGVHGWGDFGSMGTRRTWNKGLGMTAFVHLEER